MFAHEYGLIFQLGEILCLSRNVFENNSQKSFWEQFSNIFSEQKSVWGLGMFFNLFYVFSNISYK